MDLNTDLLIVLGIGLFALLGSIRLLFWARRWRTIRWLEEFAKTFADLEGKSDVCSKLASRYFHTLSKKSHKDLYHVTDFVARVQEALPQWRRLLAKSSSVDQVEDICCLIEGTLADLAGDDRHDAITLMMIKLQAAAAEIALLSEEIDLAGDIVAGPAHNKNARRVLISYGLVGNQ